MPVPSYDMFHPLGHPHQAPFAPSVGFLVAPLMARPPSFAVELPGLMHNQPPLLLMTPSGVMAIPQQPNFIERPELHPKGSASPSRPSAISLAPTSKTPPREQAARARRDPERSGNDALPISSTTGKLSDSAARRERRRRTKIAASSETLEDESGPHRAPRAHGIAARPIVSDESEQARRGLMQKLRNPDLKLRDGVALFCEFLSTQSAPASTSEWPGRPIGALGDAAKRHGLLGAARRLYRTAALQCPELASLWVEASKLEEEYGRLSRARELIREALAFMPDNENLVLRQLQLVERSGQLAELQELKPSISAARWMRAHCYASRAEWLLGDKWRTDAQLGDSWVAELLGPEDAASTLPLQQRATQTVEAAEILWHAGRLQEAFACISRLLTQVRTSSLPDKHALDILWPAVLRLQQLVVQQSAWRGVDTSCSLDVATEGPDAESPQFLLNRLWPDESRASDRRAAASLTSGGAPGIPRVPVLAPWREHLAAAVWECSPSLVPRLLSMGAALETWVFQRCVQIDILGSELLSVESVSSPIEVLRRSHVDVARDQARSCSNAARRMLRAALAAAHRNTRWRILRQGSQFELIVQLLAGMGRGDASAWETLLSAAERCAPRSAILQLRVDRCRALQAEGSWLDAEACLCAMLAEPNSEDCHLLVERVELLARRGRSAEALTCAWSAVKASPTHGRLWSLLSQLVLTLPHGSCMPRARADAYARVVELALRHVPKNGEVWVEAARLFLNPCLPFFDTAAAGDALTLALHFTPQNGDVFLEWLRLSLLREHAKRRSVPVAACARALDTRVIRATCLARQPSHGRMWSWCRSRGVDTVSGILDDALDQFVQDLERAAAEYDRAVSLVSREPASPTQPSTSLRALLQAYVGAIEQPMTVAAESAGIRPMVTADTWISNAAEPVRPGSRTPRDSTTGDPGDFILGFIELSRSVRSPWSSEPSRAERLGQVQTLLG